MAKARGVYVYGVWLKARGHWAVTSGFSEFKGKQENLAECYRDYLKPVVKRVYIPAPRNKK